MKRRTRTPYPILFPLAVLAALTGALGTGTKARAQGAACGTGFVELYFEDLRQTRCVSEAQLRAQALHRQQQQRANTTQNQQSYQQDRQARIQREQQRLTRPSQ